MVEIRIVGGAKEIVALIDELRGRRDLTNLFVESDEDIIAIAQAIYDRRQEVSNSSDS